jgi:hypothetical protein
MSPDLEKVGRLRWLINSNSADQFPKTILGEALQILAPDHQANQIKLERISQLCEMWDDGETPDELIPIWRVRAVLSGHGLDVKRTD